MRALVAGILLALVGLPAHALPGVVSGSYYHARFDGRSMACGGRFDSDELTAASNHHPCGTTLLVTYKDRDVVVQVTDRCGRCGIDLSRAAARELGLLRVGRAPVRVERLAPVSPDEIGYVPEASATNPPPEPAGSARSESSSPVNNEDTQPHDPT